MDDRLMLRADVHDALEKIYRLHPRTQYMLAKGSTHRGVSRPIAPRRAPRRAFDSAGARLGARYPDWIAALWCCETPGFGMLVHRGPHEVAQQLLDADEGARKLAARGIDVRGDVVFFDTLGEGDGAIFYGTDRSPEGDEPPRLYELRAYERNPAKALRSQLLLDKLLLFARSAEDADDYDVYSKETYASLQAVRRAPQPPFELRWEYGTPALPPPPPPPEPAPVLPSRVRHAKFGEGTIIARIGSGESEKLEIAFDSGERKTLLARFVTPL